MRITKDHHLFNSIEACGAHYFRGLYGYYGKGINTFVFFLNKTYIEISLTSKPTKKLIDSIPYLRRCGGDGYICITKTDIDLAIAEITMKYGINQREDAK